MRVRADRTQVGWKLARLGEQLVRTIPFVQQLEWTDCGAA
jgi:hypothetical protein